MWGRSVVANNQTVGDDSSRFFFFFAIVVLRHETLVSAAKVEFLGYMQIVLGLAIKFERWNLESVGISYQLVTFRLNVIQRLNVSQKQWQRYHKVWGIPCCGIIFWYPQHMVWYQILVCNSTFWYWDIFRIPAYKKKDYHDLMIFWQ